MTWTIVLSVGEKEQLYIIFFMELQTESCLIRMDMLYLCAMLTTPAGMAYISIKALMNTGSR